MIVRAWNNGAHSRSGAGYGFRVNHEDRDQYFKPEWESILLEIEDEPAEVEVHIDRERFWSETGRELTSMAIGKWLRRHGLAPWSMGNPPTFVLEPLGENRFKVVRAHTMKKGI